MGWVTLDIDKAKLYGRDIGAGPAVIFQHGLGSNEGQVADIFPDQQGYRRLTLECRGHGSSQLGHADRLSISSFASDVLTFADRQGLNQFVVGGISMGAAVALRIAAINPARVRALILVRPAWTAHDAPIGLRPCAEVGALLKTTSPTEALAAFESSATAAFLAREAPDNLSALRQLFQSHRSKDLQMLLSAISVDGPKLSESAIRSISVPSLILCNDHDYIHPLSIAHDLALWIAKAQLIEVAPKAVNPARNAAEIRNSIANFLSSLPP